MAIDDTANQDFQRAVWKGFLRKVRTWFTRSSNDLLPFDEVRQRMPLGGQHYLGLREVSISQIVGSQGRYRDFDRAFLPTQKRTRERWVNIDKAHLTHVNLPAVELYKMGEIYFVKDGNHRVSVARERGQEFIDAFVTEIDIPVSLSPDLKVNDLDLKKEYAHFVEHTGIARLRPEAALETSTPGQYGKLVEHISVHRWFLGEQRNEEVPYSEAVASWYDNVYQPLITELRDNGLLNAFSGVNEPDLYLWVVEYQGYLRDLYREESGLETPLTKEDASRQMKAEYNIPAVRKLVSVLERSDWVDNLLLQQEWAAFNGKTRLNTVRLGAQVLLTMPVLYEKLLNHIDVHRWYLGEQRGGPVSYEEAVASWYDNVYMPLVKIIREQGILDAFKNRTEGDLYLWIIEHREYVNLEYGEDMPIDRAAEQFTEDFKRRKK